MHSDDIYINEETYGEYMDRLTKEIAEHNSDFISKWPNYCRACGGHGGAVYYENHGLPYGSEAIFEPCDALEWTQCHRCGGHGLTEDSEGPCTVCDWNYDDGLEEL